LPMPSHNKKPFHDDVYCVANMIMIGESVTLVPKTLAGIGSIFIL
jgi:hypothetical protein